MPHPDMSANNGHPDEGLLHEWLDDQLSPQDAAEMQAHIASCAECGARVAEARGLIAASHRILSALDEVPSGVIPNPTFGGPAVKKARVAFRWQRLAPIAAVLVLAVTMLRPGSVEMARQAETRANVPEVQREPAAAPAMAPATDAVADAAVPTPKVAPQRESVGAAEKRSVADAAPKRSAPSVAEERSAVTSAQAAPAATVAATPPATTGSVSNAPPAGAATAAAVTAPTPVPAPPAPPAPAMLPGRVAGANVSRAAGAATVTQASSAELEASLKAQAARADTINAPRLLLRAPNQNFAADAATLGVAMADSVTLTRNTCTPVCEVTALHVNALGVVRFSLGTGNTQRTQMNQLSETQRTRLNELITNTFPAIEVRTGNIACEVRGNNAAGAPALQLLLSFPKRVPLREGSRCGKSAAEVTELGAAIDSIAGVESLKNQSRRRD